MKKTLLGFWAAMLLAASAAIAGEPRGFYRITSADDTGFTDFGPNGIAVWTNAVIGGAGRIQCATALPAAEDDWRDAFFFTATGAVMSVTLPLECPPAGMVLIPAGSFAMGNATNVFPPDESWPDELPQHTVFISAFFMDQTHVTETHWDQVRLWAVDRGYDDLPLGSWRDGTNYSQGPLHPIHLVSWFDAVKWCNARSEREELTPVYYTDAGFTTVFRTGTDTPYANWAAKGYRLPTEAEWEKAARGGVAHRRFPWSDSHEIQHDRANYFSRTNELYDTSPTREFHPDHTAGGEPFTSPVDAFPPNGYGLYDMSGNVFDWCWDWYSSDYYAVSPHTDPRGPDNPGSRMLRGGAWARNAVRARVAYRAFNDPSGRVDFIGFRCVRGL